MERSSEAQTDDGYCFDLASVEMQLSKITGTLFVHKQRKHTLCLSVLDLPKQESVVSIRIPNPVFETDRFQR